MHFFWTLTCSRGGCLLLKKIRKKKIFHGQRQSLQLVVLIKLVPNGSYRLVKICTKPPPLTLLFTIWFIPSVLNQSIKNNQSKSNQWSNIQSRCSNRHTKNTRFLKNHKSILKKSSSDLLECGRGGQGQPRSMFDRADGQTGSQRTLIKGCIFGMPE